MCNISLNCKGLAGVKKSKEGLLFSFCHGGNRSQGIGTSPKVSCWGRERLGSSCQPRMLTSYWAHQELGDHDVSMMDETTPRLGMLGNAFFCLNLNLLLGPWRWALRSLDHSSFLFPMWPYQIYLSNWYTEDKYKVGQLSPTLTLKINN